MKFGAIKFFRRSKKSSTSRQKSSSHGFGNDDAERDKYRLYNSHNGYYNQAAENGDVFAPWLELPSPILERIFTFVCPHTADETYETCEQSAMEDACMLCDLRDLSHTGQVCKTWRKTAIKLIYHSIRIDSVHYCEREIDLSEKRKRRSRFDRNGAPLDPAAARLHLLCRTLREDPTRLGKLVQYFKTPYMLRESSAATLARTIAVLPNLRYVDLPEGLFVDDPAHQTLKLEIQARCPDLRKMTYMGGSERSLEALGRGNVWLHLEVLELARINMDPASLRQGLAALQHLRALKLSDCRMVDDDMFRHNDMQPALPALEELILKAAPRVTADGLVAYLSRPDAQQGLKVLSLTETGVHPAALHSVLAAAPRLATLSITEEVQAPFPTQTGPVPPLSNWSLETLRYEITLSPTTSPYASVTAGYYNYLASSLFAGGLPRLMALYVRDENFSDMLLGLPPPTPGFAGSPRRPSSSNSAAMFNGGNGALSPLSQSSFGSPGNPPPRFGSNNPFASVAGSPRGPGVLSLNNTLEVFTKGEDDLTWGSIRMDPFDAYDDGGGSGGRHARNGSASSVCPTSSYGLTDIGAGWQGAGGARKSIMIQGNGNGGFLAVPGEGGMGAGRRRSSAASAGGAREDLWPRPSSSHGPKKGDRDLWR
ncbi:hypothetical protein GGR56DRAFT_659173 [Xylariaceae sp. FL0804]|nr:hypothetical protein GGR56DRAFT_659173 [Xylariaceae sp. FL0804]